MSAAVVAVLAAGLMAARFGAGESAYRELAALPASSVTAGQGHPVREGQININSASAEELDKLPGIGEVRAAAIVAWRAEHGPFRYPEELLQVPGIGEAILSEILDLVTVG